jgi:hypothetical protein
MNWVSSAKHQPPVILIVILSDLGG